MTTQELQEKLNSPPDLPPCPPGFGNVTWWPVNKPMPARYWYLAKWPREWLAGQFPGCAMSWEGWVCTPLDAALRNLALEDELNAAARKCDELQAKLAQAITFIEHAGKYVGEVNVNVSDRLESYRQAAAAVLAEIKEK